MPGRGEYLPDPTEGIARGHAELRTLREIMNEVYRLFDRRCRTETAGCGRSGI